MKILNISHNDLDGYMSSYIINKKYINVDTININYDEIDYVLDNIDNCYDYIIITDLNLNKKQVEKLDEFVKNSKYSTKYFVYDHHMWDSLTLETHENNIKVDTSISASELTYKELGLDSEIEKYIKNVTIIDLWKDSEFNKDGVYFAKIQMLYNLLFNMMPHYDRSIDTQIKLKLIDKVLNSDEYIFSMNTNKMLSDIIAKINNKPHPDQHWLTMLIEDSVRTFTERVNYKLYKKDPQIQIKRVKDYITIFIDGTVKTINYNNVSRSMYQLASKPIMRRYKFSSSQFVDIMEENIKDVVYVYSDGEILSFRSFEGTAVKVAKQLGGGGHSNASGCSCKDATIDTIINVIINLK